jgi:type III secretory pathway component EscT
MLWYVVLGGIILIILFDSYLLLVKPKPSFKSRLKRIFNEMITTMAIFMPMNIGMLLISAYVGFIYIGEQSSDIEVIVVASGMQWGMYCMILLLTIAMLWKVFTPMLKKKPDEFSQWIKHLDIDGMWRYTEEEKAYNKEQDIKSKEQIRRWFPFIKKFDKKVV